MTLPPLHRGGQGKSDSGVGRDGWICLILLAMGVVVAVVTRVWELL